jgi:hypothetical protein
MNTFWSYCITVHLPSRFGSSKTIHLMQPYTSILLLYDCHNFPLLKEPHTSQTDSIIWAWYPWCARCFCTVRSVCASHGRDAASVCVCVTCVCVIQSDMSVWTSSYTHTVSLYRHMPYGESHIMHAHTADLGILAINGQMNRQQEGCICFCWYAVVNQTQHSIGIYCKVDPNCRE